MKRSASYWIRKLGLKEHPEGGYYREVYRAPESIPARGLPHRYRGKRAFSTSIYFLLRGRDVSRLHRLKTDETWHFNAGSPLTIHVISPKGRYSRVTLGHEAFQYTVRHGNWFGATVNDPAGFTLVGCTVAPGFDFRDFEVARRADLIQRCPERRRLIVRLTPNG